MDNKPIAARDLQSILIRVMEELDDVIFYGVIHDTVGLSHTSKSSTAPAGVNFRSPVISTQDRLCSLLSLSCIVLFVALGCHTAVV